MVENVLRNSEVSNHKCCVCNSNLHDISYAGVAQHLERCMNCDLIFNRDSFELTVEPTEVFSDQFFDEFGIHENMFFSEILTIKKNITKNINDISILDVGCGRGDFLKFCKARGLHCSGVELSTQLLRQVIDSGISGYSTIDDFLKVAKKVDIIYCSHALEHFMNPFLMLKKMREALADDGLIFITVPASTFVSRKFEILLKKRNMLNGWGIFYDVHLTYFNPGSLKKMIENAGFSNISMFSGVFGENFIRRYVKNEKIVKLLFTGVLQPIQKILWYLGFTLNIGLVARKY